MTFTVTDQKIEDVGTRYRRIMKDTPYCNPYDKNGPGNMFSSQSQNSDKRMVMDVLAKFFSVYSIVKEHAAKYGSEDFSGNYGFFCGSIYGDSLLEQQTRESIPIPMANRIPQEKSDILIVAKLLEYHNNLVSSVNGKDMPRLTRGFLQGITAETERSLGRFSKSLEEISKEEIYIGKIAFNGIDYTGKRASSNGNHALQQELIEKDELPEIQPTNLSKDLTLNDVGGFYAAKEAARKILLELKNPKRLAAYGLKNTKGILLYGPPGTGKTMFARAFGAEIGKQFYEVKLEEMMDKYVGNSEKNIARLMSKTNSVIFFDEFDSLGKKKGEENNALMDRITNLIATKIDGVSSNNSNLYLAATNNLLALDSKIIRRGRFDRTIYIGVPNRQELQDILEKQVNMFRKRARQVDPNADHFKNINLSMVGDKMFEKSQQLAQQHKVPIVGSDVEAIIQDTMGDMFTESCTTGTMRSPRTEEFIAKITNYNKMGLWMPEYEEDAIAKFGL